MSTPSREEFVSSIARLAESVYDFQERFNESPLASSSPDDHLKTLRDRLPLLIEEMGEHAQDLNQANLEGAALEMADVAFVAIGSLNSLAYIGTNASHTVAKKNDDKTHETHVIEESSGKLVRRS